MKNTEQEQKKGSGGDVRIERMVFCPVTREFRSVLRDCQGCDRCDFIDEHRVRCRGPK